VPSAPFFNRQNIVLFFLTGILSVLAAGWFYSFSLTKGEYAVATLKVSFPSKKPISGYDPAHIQLAPDYILCENLFSPLVELDPAGRLVGGVAEKFEWRGNRLIFKIRPNLRTIGGIPITAADAAFSLKRLLILGSSTHGNLKPLLCKSRSLKSIDDLCPGIEVADSELILKVEKRDSFLIPLLASIDFAVIPQSAVDPSTLKIVDYKETSGPYFLEGSSENEFRLVANPFHYHYSNQIPQKVELIFTDSIESSLKGLRNGQIDFLTTIDHVPASEMIKFSSDHTGFNLHQTMNIRSLVTTFTKLGLHHLSEVQRLDIGRILRKSFSGYLQKKDGFEIQTQIFPVFGAAGLKKDKIGKLEQLLAQDVPSMSDLPLRVRIVRLEPFEDYKKLILKALPNAVVERGTVPSFEKFDTQHLEPHLFISGPDLSYQEDFSLLSYYMGTGYFGIFGKEGEEWLGEYQKIDDQEERLNKLRELHFQTITHARTMPIAVYPYAALVRKPWQIGLSNFFADTQLWLIKRQH
jgi:hypothetical protein